MPERLAANRSVTALPNEAFGKEAQLIDHER